MGPLGYVATGIWPIWLHAKKMRYKHILCVVCCTQVTRYMYRQVLASRLKNEVCIAIVSDDSCLIELSNWRPLTLLNYDVDYKILAKVIGKRIESILFSLIHSDQTGFIKGRFIGQNVRLLNGIIEYTDVK